MIAETITRQEGRSTETPQRSIPAFLKAAFFKADRLTPPEDL